MIQLKLKRIGNHWYPEVNHNSLDEISLDEKIERFLFALSRVKSSDTIVLEIYSGGSILYDNTLQFAEESITRYFTTNDDFEIDFWIGDRNFKMSSTLYYLLECHYNFNFHDTVYRINVGDN